MRYTYQHNGQTHIVTLEQQADGHYQVSIGERTFPVQAKALPNGAWRITLDGQSQTVHSAAHGDQRFLQVDNETFTLTVPDTRPARRKTANTGDELTAQMPGQVTAVMLQAGDAVKRGQTLLLLEAMKMEIRVTAPADGYIHQILVEVGQVVERGQQLVIFKTTD